MRRRALCLACLALAVAGFSSGAPAISPPADLKDARSRLASASRADYPAMLEAFSLELPPSDALALLAEGSASIPSESRQAFLSRAGDLCLLLGLFGDAASRYEEAASLSSPKDARLLLKSARCALAAGEADKASQDAALVIMGAANAEDAAAARLVGAWGLALKGRAADACALALSAIGGSQDSSGATASGESSSSAALRREARFLVWLCSEGQAKAQAKQALVSEFPRSPEALVASGEASPPPLPHWYLNGLGAAIAKPSGEATAKPSGASSPAGAGSGKAVSPNASPSGQEGAPSAGSPQAPQAGSGSPPASPKAQAAAVKGRRLQVGYFSREDYARDLKDELAAKGFSASIEEKTRPNPNGASAATAEVKRWIVLVDGGADPAKTMQALKDSGYESYYSD